MYYKWEIQGIVSENWWQLHLSVHTIRKRSQIKQENSQMTKYLDHTLAVSLRSVRQPFPQEKKIFKNRWIFFEEIFIENSCRKTFPQNFRSKINSCKHLSIQNKPGVARPSIQVWQISCLTFHVLSRILQGCVMILEYLRSISKWKINKYLFSS